jgi:hypothetical protein
MVKHCLLFIFFFNSTCIYRYILNLFNFVRWQRIIASKGDYEDWEEPEIVPKCLLSHLATCSLRNYIGIPCELHFAKYIMKNSRVLSAMTIQSDKFLDTDSKLLMLMELTRCPRSSATCELLFIK